MNIETKPSVSSELFTFVSLILWAAISARIEQDLVGTATGGENRSILKLYTRQVEYFAITDVSNCQAKATNNNGKTIATAARIIIILETR